VGVGIGVGVGAGTVGDGLGKAVGPLEPPQALIPTTAAKARPTA
jgi:hypothetical protein